MELKQKMIPLARRLERIGHKIFATEKTAQVLQDAGVDATVVYKLNQRTSKPNVADMIIAGEIAMVINIPVPKRGQDDQVYEDHYHVRRKAIEFNVPVLASYELADFVIECIEQLQQEGITSIEDYISTTKILSLNEYHDSLKGIYW
jgi:carbamoyl-phosphate synthase large subunit